LTYAAASDTRDPAGVPYGTRGSYTLRIVAPDFRLDNLTVENSFDYPANAAKAADDPTRLRNPQAVAVMTDGANDRAHFTRCRITGYQDTLFPNAGRHYFHGCAISGHVDFIFGAGQAVFEACDIVSRDRGSRTNNGYIAAPSTAMGAAHGFLFIHSRLKKESPAMAPGSVSLGRPWHPSADPLVFSRAAYVDVHMDDHIGARGWDRMSSVDPATGTRFWFEPANAGFFEHGSTGPGAAASPTRRVLTDGEVRGYTIPAVLGDWNPTRTPAPKRD
ncbi:MAG TPA: pectinesterase family protein, partial [Longimicrobium sp.]